MKRLYSLSVIPSESAIAEGFGHVDYFDVYQIKQTTTKSAEVLSREIMKMPKWVDLLMKLRNTIVGVLGLKTDLKGQETETIFTLIENRKNEIIMGEDDAHLNFRASVLNNAIEGTVSLITVVHFNNKWGRFYFFPVKPFHKVILKSLLRRYLKTNTLNHENE